MTPFAPSSRVHHQNEAPNESLDCVRSDLATVYAKSEHKSDPRVPICNGTDSKQKQGGPKRAQVIRLPWTDSRGVGYYTGQVNALVQPHGIGILRYGDGTVLSSTWCNGMPLRNQSFSKPSRESGVNEVNDEGSNFPLPVKHHLPSPEPQQTPAPRRTLKLGDIGAPQDMHIENDPEKAYANAASLPIHSFAFICRSNGEWTYAIVADRSVESGPEATIRFVVDRKGNTKIMKSKYWSPFIRLVKKPRAGGAKEEPKGKQDPESLEEKLERMSLVPKPARRVVDEPSKTSASEEWRPAKLQKPVDVPAKPRGSPSRKPARRSSMPVNSDDLEAAGKPDKGMTKSTSFHNKALRRSSWQISSSTILEDSTSSAKGLTRSTSFHRACSQSCMDQSSMTIFEGSEYAKMNSFHMAVSRVSADMSVEDEPSKTSALEEWRPAKLQKPVGVPAKPRGSLSRKPARRSSMPVSSDDLEAAGKPDKGMAKSTSFHNKALRRSSWQISSSTILEDSASSAKGLTRSTTFHRAFSQSCMDQSSMTIFEGSEYAKMNSFHMAVRRVSADMSVRTSDSASRK